MLTRPLIKRKSKFQIKNFFICYQSLKSVEKQWQKHSKMGGQQKSTSPITHSFTNSLATWTGDIAITITITDTTWPKATPIHNTRDDCVIVLRLWNCLWRKPPPDQQTAKTSAHIELVTLANYQLIMCIWCNQVYSISSTPAATCPLNRCDCDW